MIYECTDCSNCANFDFGYRVYCMHPNLPAEQVCEYFPVGNRDAESCSGFDEGCSIMFDASDIDEYEVFSIEKYGDVTYQGIRDWLDMQQKTS